jgi:dolichol kinase
METTLEFIIVLSLLAASTLVIARNLLVPGLVLFGFLVPAFPLLFRYQPWCCLLAAISLMLFVVTLYRITKDHSITLGKQSETKRWRVFIRPAAALFIPISEFLGHYFLLYLIGILCVIFIGMDLYRLFSGRKFHGVYKRSENRKFSSMTGFLVATFIVFLLFRNQIAYLCLVFIVFGDLAAKVAGVSFGRTILIHRRTLEGSLGFFAGALFSGAIVASVFSISLPFLVTGAAIATIVELFSYHVDDNFTVGILTGGALVALEYFSVF